MIDGWSPGIGDPTLLGWATTIAYLLAAWLCVRATAPIIRRDTASKRMHRFWSTLAITLALLAINKQLDLQSLLTVVGRRMAHEEGWYDARRTVQCAFIIGIVAGSGLVLGLLLLHLRRMTNWVWLAGLGLTFLLTFVAIRAASFHHMDAAIHATWAGIYIGHVLELGGIAAIILAAVGERRIK